MKNKKRTEVQGNTNLTRKQQDVLDYLIDNQDTFIRPPTLDELCFAMGLKSRGSLHNHIQGLINAGLVQAPNCKQQGVRLTEQALAFKNAADATLPRNEKKFTPFVGKIAAGVPIEALENISHMAIPDEIKTNNPYYILQVKGDSMIEGGIFDAD